MEPRLYPRRVIIYLGKGHRTIFTEEGIRRLDSKPAACVLPDTELRKLLIP